MLAEQKEDDAYTVRSLKETIDHLEEKHETDLGALQKQYEKEIVKLKDDVYRLSQKPLDAIEEVDEEEEPSEIYKIPKKKNESLSSYSLTAIPDFDDSEDEVDNREIEIDLKIERLKADFDIERDRLRRLVAEREKELEIKEKIIRKFDIEMETLQRENEETFRNVEESYRKRINKMQEEIDKARRIISSKETEKLDLQKTVDEQEVALNEARSRSASSSLDENLEDLAKSTTKIAIEHAVELEKLRDDHKNQIKELSQRYENNYEDLKRENDRLIKELNEHCQLNEKLKDEKMQLNDDISLLQSNFDTEIIKIKLELEEKHREEMKKRVQIIKQESTDDNLIADKMATDKENYELLKELKLAQKQLESKEIEFDNLTQKYDKLKEDGRNIELEEEINELKKKIIEKDNLFDNLKLKMNNSVHEYENKLKNLREELNLAREDFKTSQINMDKFLRENEEKDIEIKDFQIKLQENNGKLTESFERLEECETEIINLKNNLDGKNTENSKIKEENLYLNQQIQDLNCQLEKQKSSLESYATGNYLSIYKFIYTVY